ncbi:MAG: hypothetical protein GXX99_00940 [Clostridiales bacterium]|nr:hypothetical protein [Clostridiales bacterium]
MSRRKPFGRAPFGFGSLSIFCTLLVCCLTAFSVLSIVSAQAGWRLSQKNADLVQAYYAADGQAVLLADQLQRRWEGERAPALSALEELLEAGGAQDRRLELREGAVWVAFSLPIGDGGIQRLSVELLLYPPGAQPRVEPQVWRMETDGTGEVYDNHLPVWPG